MRKIKILIPILVVLASACTYSFSGYFPSRLRKVSVHVFQNKTLMYGLENSVTEYFINNLRKDGRFEIVSDDRAGLIIKGSVVDYEKTPFKFDSQGNIESYNITLKLELEFFDKTKGEDYMPRATYIGNGTFNTSGETEEDGIKRAVADIYSTVIHKLFQVSF